MVTGYKWPGLHLARVTSSGCPQYDRVEHARAQNGKQDISHNLFNAITAVTFSAGDGDQLVEVFAVRLHVRVLTGYGLQGAGFVPVWNYNPAGFMLVCHLCDPLGAPFVSASIVTYRGVRGFRESKIKDLFEKV